MGSNLPITQDAPEDLPVGRGGRYAGIPAARYVGLDGRRIVYLTRRFLPQPEMLVLAQEHVVQPGERVDHIAAKFLGDSGLFWRLCDANRAMDPAALAEPGLRLRITLPAELSWSGGGSDDA